MSKTPEKHDIDLADDSATDLPADVADIPTETPLIKFIKPTKSETLFGDLNLGDTKKEDPRKRIHVAVFGSEII